MHSQRCPCVQAVNRKKTQNSHNEADEDSRGCCSGAADAAPSSGLYSPGTPSDAVNSTATACSVSIDSRSRNRRPPTQARCYAGEHIAHGTQSRCLVIVDVDGELVL